MEHISAYTVRLTHALKALWEGRKGGMKEGEAVRYWEGGRESQSSILDCHLISLNIYF